MVWVVWLMGSRIHGLQALGFFKQPSCRLAGFWAALLQQFTASTIKSRMSSTWCFVVAYYRVPKSC